MSFHLPFRFPLAKNENNPRNNSKATAEAKTESEVFSYTQPLTTVLETLNVDPKHGLTSQQISGRQAKYGPNQLKEKRPKSIIARFFNQFKSPLILVLVGAAIISFIIACGENDPTSFFEPALIIFIVVLNAIMGTLQENRAEKALEALRKLTIPHARALRDGTEKIINASELVPGDIIHLEAGDSIPADARLLQSTNLTCEESALTGESVPSEKNAKAVIKPGVPLGDRENLLFFGCSVSTGTADAVVVATGMDTEMGKIAHLLNDEPDEETPLQQKLAKLGKYLSVLVLTASTIVFIIGLMTGLPAHEIFMTAVSLAVSAIPEGLPIIVTILLSLGVQRMVKKNALIRNLPAVETLGCASVICTDKTGTLTQNRMTITKVYTDGATAETELKEENSTPAVHKLLEYGTLCCDSSISIHGDKVQHIGDPTETAIVLAAFEHGMPKDELNQKSPRLAEIPFDSNQKLMATINKINGKNILIVKGALDIMAPRCTSGDLVTAKKVNEQMSSEALRVLAIAYQEIPSIPEKPTLKRLGHNLTLLGLIGMIDPPHAEAKPAVAICRKAGIKPVMITGDHIATASAIAKDLGILRDDDKAITGTELNAMSDAEFANAVEDISVYARVSPEDKLRIVKAWQSKDQVVSMTGDGVNDAPALKAADIGCAMGITGTDVAKGAADIILTNDNFATIVDAVREGRGIYANIRKVVGYLLGTNIGEVVAVFVSMLLWHETPFLSMQLLWINFVTDSLPAIALGMEPTEPDIMDRPPKPKSEGIFAGHLGVHIVLQGLMFGTLALIGFILGRNITGTLAGGQTTAFLVLTLSQLVQAFNMRSRHSLFKIGFFTNRKLNLTYFISLILVALVLFTPLRIAFGMEILPPSLYLVGVVLSFVPLFVMEIAKLFGPKPNPTPTKKK